MTHAVDTLLKTQKALEFIVKEVLDNEEYKRKPSDVKIAIEVLKRIDTTWDTFYSLYSEKIMKPKEYRQGLLDGFENCIKYLKNFKNNPF